VLAYFAYQSAIDRQATEQNEAFGLRKMSRFRTLRWLHFHNASRQLACSLALIEGLNFQFSGILIYFIWTKGLPPLFGIPPVAPFVHKKCEQFYCVENLLAHMRRRMEQEKSRA